MPTSCQSPTLLLMLDGSGGHRTPAEVQAPAEVPFLARLQCLPLWLRRGWQPLYLPVNFLLHNALCAWLLLGRIHRVLFFRRGRRLCSRHHAQLW